MQYGVELIIIMVATLAQSLSSGSPSVNVVGLIIFWRVIMVRNSGLTCSSQPLIGFPGHRHWW